MSRKNAPQPAYRFRVKTAGGRPAIVAAFIGNDEPATVEILGRRYRLLTLTFQTVWNGPTWPPLEFRLVLETEERGAMSFSGRLPDDGRRWIRDESGPVMEWFEV